MSFFFCWCVIGEVNCRRKWGWGLYSLQIGFQFSFVLWSWPQNTGSPFFFSQTDAHRHTHRPLFFFSLRISGHLQSGCGFCKHNLLRLPRSVSSMHQQPCLSEQHTHTHTCIHSWEWTGYCMDSRRGGESYYTSCLFLVRYLSGPRSCYWNSRRHHDLATFVHSPSQEQEYRLSVPKLLSSHTATHHPTQTDSLIKGDKEIEKGFPLVAGLKQHDS